MQRRFPFPLPDGWFQVAYGDELSTEHPLALHYFEREWVAFRDAEGRARVLDAHCPHLGAHLGHGGEIVEGRLRCPFHHWEFDGEGYLERPALSDGDGPIAEVRRWARQFY